MANEAAATLGRMGGFARRDTLTPDERREIANMGATARWSNQEDRLVEQFRYTLRRAEGREERIKMLARAFVRRMGLLGPRSLIYVDYEISDASVAAANMPTYSKSVLGVFDAGASPAQIAAEIESAVRVG